MVLLLLLLHRFKKSVCVCERWHSTGGFRDTNGRSKTTQVVFFGTLKTPRQLNGHKSGVSVLRTLLYTRLPSHLLTGLPWISVSTTYALCCCANIPLVIYVRPIPFFFLLGAKSLKTKRKSFKSCLSVLVEVSAATTVRDPRKEKKILSHKVESSVSSGHAN